MAVETGLMGRGASDPRPLLTIAGSDSGGAAGLQADLKTWAAFSGRVYGMSAVTAVTAQNSARVVAAHFLPPALVAAQIDAVLGDYGAAAIKTGFLGRVDLIEAVAERLIWWRDRLTPRPFILIDPVLVNHRGEAMFGPEVTAAYRALLFPPADLVTPNAAEAVLLGLLAGDQPPPETAGQGSEGSRGHLPTAPLHPPIPQTSAPHILVTGLRRGDQVADRYWDGRAWTELPQPRVETINTHGSGDTLSAAICAYVALGYELPDAVRRAQAYTHAAIRRGAAWRLGAGHGPVGHGLPNEESE